MEAEAERDNLRAENERLREALQWIALQPCENEYLGIPCTSTDDCITEYCFPCYARVALGGEE